MEFSFSFINSLNEVEDHHQEAEAHTEEEGEL
jgi:hypothetical protein